MRIKRGPKRFGPRVTAKRLNEYMLKAWETKGGATITVDGYNRPLQWDRPVVLQPGIRLDPVGEGRMYGRSRTRIEPRHSGPVFILDDGPGQGPDAEPWGASRLGSFQIWPTHPDVWALDVRGGNTLLVDGLCSGYGKYPLKRGVTCEPGPDTRWNDAQYAIYRRVRFTRCHELVTLTRNIPDTTFEDCLLYGTEQPDSTGFLGAEGVNNIKISRCHVQFTGRPYDIDGWEWLVTAGQFENRSGHTPYAPFIVRLGPSARFIRFDGVSMANLSSITNNRLFDIHPQARNYAFRDLTGHVNAGDVPTGLENHFSWLP